MIFHIYNTNKCKNTWFDRIKVQKWAAELWSKSQKKRQELNFQAWYRNLRMKIILFDARLSIELGLKPIKKLHFSTMDILLYYTRPVAFLASYKKYPLFTAFSKLVTIYYDFQRFFKNPSINTNPLKKAAEY